MYETVIKKCLDVLCAVVLLLLIWPLLLIIIVSIRISSNGKVIFRQKRVGKDKKIFNLFKFRTMKPDAPSDVPTHMLNNPEAYITRLGKILRRTSMDELPQLINILRGQMSFVGPRPALYNQYDLIEARDKVGVNRLTPGLTGWAQVNGRDEIPILRKAELDGEYLQNIGFKMDLKILLTTIVQTIFGVGIKEGKDNKNIEGEIDVQK